MGFFDKISKAVISNSHGFIEGGKNKKGGGHDHTTNKGDDRTPAQKSGDAKRRKENRSESEE